jgi:hypothetical protein
MNRSDLDKTLKSAQMPERAPDYWENFPGQVRRNLGRSPAPLRSQPRLFPRIAWGVAIAAACLVIGLTIGHRMGRQEHASADTLLQNEKLLRETMAMFPNRIRAIVQDEKGMSLVLSDGEDVPASTPLYVSVCDGEHCSALVTFSGQEVELAGHKVTILSDAEGGVILIAEGLLWSSKGTHQMAGQLRIQAKQLRGLNAG